MTFDASALDVVYPLKRSGGTYRELRYSMRSLRNLPHRRVFVAGGCPGWLSDRVRHLPARRQSNPYRDAAGNIVAACLSDQVSDPFVLMNDDFFVMDAIDSVPVLNRGRVRDLIEWCRESGNHRAYARGMVETLSRVEASGFPDPWSFELHVPMVVTKSSMLDAVHMGVGVDVWQYRTACGALSGLSGDTVSDVKVHGFGPDFPTHLPFLSTSDESFAFGRVGHMLKSRFAQESPYEV